MCKMCANFTYRNQIHWIGYIECVKTNAICQQIIVLEHTYKKLKRKRKRIWLKFEIIHAYVFLNQPIFDK